MAGTFHVVYIGFKKKKNKEKKTKNLTKLIPFQTVVEPQEEGS